MDFIPYINLVLHTDFIYRFIIYGFYIQILHTDLLLMDSNPYVITYGSKSICNYLQILYTDLLHKDFTYEFTIYRFYIQILHTDLNS